jgi:hypothetical protein
LCSFVGKEVGFKLQVAPTAGDEDDREDDGAVIFPFFKGVFACLGM